MKSNICDEVHFTEDDVIMDLIKELGGSVEKKTDKRYYLGKMSNFRRPSNVPSLGENKLYERRTEKFVGFDSNGLLEQISR